MSQASQKQLFEADQPARRVQVLAPLPLAKAYDYALPVDVAAQVGDYVRIPFGKRETVGVVWSDATDASVNPARLKTVLQKFNVPPMTSEHRTFIERVARYTMSDLGSVLKMSLSVPEALQPSKTTLSYTYPDILPPKLSAHRKKVIDFLADGVPRRAADIARHVGCSTPIIRAMAEAGQLSVVETNEPFPCEMTEIPATDLKLSAAQASSAAALTKIVQARAFSPVLLDGVTGSGKTEVYFEAIAEAVRQGRQVLVLLPEISLSTQFLQRFERRFGLLPAVWHSEVTPAQRRLVWQGVANGKTRVVVGARSALFLPFRDLGLVVVDEEHDASYKQEEGVLYNARDMAVLRGSLAQAPVVLVSATPSLETQVNARAGKYQFLHLPGRYAGAALPDVKIVDMRKEPPGRGKFLSPPLEKAIVDNLAAGEQSILFLNRRGYAPLTLCRTCGHRFQCPSCTAWLVEHKRHGRMQCHHCGYAQATPKECPSCHDAESLVACGPGVERIQEEVQQLVPDARTLILASDVVSSPNMISDAVRAIEARDVDVIVGTQIVAKGHHFPSLTLVGVVDADLGLAGGDLRAGERTFQLLHQVSGRAGRGEKPGRVIIQTYMPEQRVICALGANDRDAFLNVEADERERAGMPPYGRLAALILSGPDELKLDQFCRHLAQMAPRYDDIRILGPAPAPMAYLRGKHRRRFLVKTGKDIVVQKFLQEWLTAAKVPSSIQLKIDIDPQSFF